MTLPKDDDVIVVEGSSAMRLTLKISRESKNRGIRIGINYIDWFAAKLCNQPKNAKFLIYRALL